MKRKYTQEDLNKALDKIKQGPIGTKPQWYWENINNLSISTTQEIKDKIKESYSGKKRKEANKIAQETMNNSPSIRTKQQQGNKDKMDKVIAYKVTTTGKAKTWKVTSKLLIGTFNSQYECAKFLKIPPGYVSGVLLEKYKTVKGYTFEYAKSIN